MERVRHLTDCAQRAGIATWIVPTQFSSYYDDSRMEEAFCECRLRNQICSYLVSFSGHHRYLFADGIDA